MNNFKDTFFEHFPRVSISQINEWGLSSYLAAVNETCQLEITLTTDKLEPLFKKGENEVIAFEKDIQRINYKGTLLEKVRRSEEIYSIRIGEEIIYLKQLSYEKKHIGYLFLKSDTQSLSTDEKRFIDDISSLLIPWVVSEKRMRETDQSYQKSFVFDLLHNHFDSYLMMNEQAKRWGWDFSQTYQLMVMEIDDDRGQTTMVEQQIHRILHLEGLEFIVTEFNSEFVILYQEKFESVHKTRSKEIAQKIIKNISKDIEGNEIRIGIGIGHLYLSAMDLCRAFQEAKMALKLSVNSKDRIQVTHFDELGIMKLLANIRQELLIDFQKEHLQLLEEYDLRSEEQLTETLRLFLVQSGNIKFCADKMFIHPNTLRHRIKKIETVLGVNLDNYEDITNLMTAFIIRDSR
ncbi:PucR family transcriptional regulator [Salipaludibacillus daqingensis]|uniref:PucR family transcriptional regulator n=1 Tax=Salipaludibacillus daqingensis TaxID=3041001 RepID=UPI00247555EF|nr:helix-turn-helix domain-containing protein [Salipaludibacillus daqingensis]